MKSWQALSVSVLFAWAASALAQSIPPTITNQPAASLTNNAGTVASFTVGAAGTAPLHYQWRKNGTALTGATIVSLVLSSVLAADQGSYTVVVTNSSGSATSSVAKLTVIDPVILEQPYSDAVAAGDYAVFHVNAAGTVPLTYQWRKNGTGIAGETADMILIDPVRTADAGSYSVVVSNALKSRIISSSAILTVLIPPAITTQPQNKVVTAGTNVTFSVRATGTSPLSYQWFKDLNVVPGATNADLTLTNVGPLDAATYYANVFNTAGSTNSNVATLTVNVPPLFLDQPSDQTVVLGDEYIGFVVDVDPASTDPLSYNWYHNGLLMAGETNWNYTITHVINEVEDYAVDASDAGTYQVRVQNVAGTVYSSNAILTVLVPPIITRQSVSQAVRTNTYATFSVTVDPTSTTPLSHQWFFDDSDGVNDPIPILGATTSNLTFLVTNMNQYGAYSCQISNTSYDDLALYTTNTDGAILTVIQETNKPTVTLLSPSNYAAWIEPVITVQGTAADNAGVRTVQFYLGGDYSVTNSATTTNGWTNWVATFPAAIGTNLIQAEAFDTSGNKSALTTNRYIIRVASDRLTLAAFPPAAGTVSGVTNGQWLAINSNYTATASVNSALDYAFTNWARTTNGTDWVTSNVPVLNFVMQSNLTLHANFAAKLPSILTQPQNLAVISGQNAAFNIAAAGAAPLSYQWRFNSVDIPGATATNYSVINAQPTNAGTYSVVVINPAGSTNSSNATLTVNVPPTITNQPQSLTVNAGQNATFTVSANGTAPLSYQWRFNSVNLAGATETSCGVLNAQGTNAGTYSVVVTNVAGSATSSMATLTVNLPPAITNQPQNLTVIAGHNATFAVSAAGAAPLGYQWRFNSVNIAGATGTSYSIFNAQLTNAGTYSVVITNMVGATTSQPAKLTLAGPVANISVDGTIVTISFTGMTGFKYAVEYQNAINPIWVPLSSPVTGTGSLVVLQDAGGLLTSRFYRVRCYSGY